MELLNVPEVSTLFSSIFSQAHAAVLGRSFQHLWHYSGQFQPGIYRWIGPNLGHPDKFLVSEGQCVATIEIFNSVDESSVTISSRGAVSSLELCVKAAWFALHWL